MKSIIIYKNITSDLLAIGLQINENISQTIVIPSKENNKIKILDNYFATTRKRTEELLFRRINEELSKWLECIQENKIIVKTLNSSEMKSIF